MIYVTSDLHGTSLEKFKKLLNKAGFGKNEDDFLFIIGDVLDRQGEGGIALLRWLSVQTNIELLCGNHEKFLLDSAWLFEKITEESLSLIEKGMDAVSTWLANGGEPTITALKKLIQTEPDAVTDILNYLREAPLYQTVTIDDGKDSPKDFLLVHSGLGNFDENKDLDDYTVDELLWTRPDINEDYFDDIITVFGHTPTVYYGRHYKGKILRTKTWIDIDTSDTTPTILCLNTMQEFRLED